MTRRSKREIDTALEDLESEDRDIAGLITVLSTLQNGGDVVDVPDRRDLVRVDGEVKRLLPNAREQLEGWAP